MGDSRQLREELLFFLNEKMGKMVLSNPRDKERSIKTVVRPIMIRDSLMFQVETFIGKQAFHQNLTTEETIQYIEKEMTQQYKNGELISRLGHLIVLVGKKGTITIKKKLLDEGNTAGSVNPEELSHNRKKQYILKEGEPVPFLVSLGVMTKEGKILQAKYDKFRQINRFLEFIEDILPKLDKNRENMIIDFGCGKSYLTFAMYYYLKELKGYPIRIVGLDLKTEVITFCNQLSREFGFENLTFERGDIAEYEGVKQVDMVVTLHACDTATDYALQKAISWNAKVILSVPCCQHELNGQIDNALLDPILQYGLLKERMASLITDGIRAQLLEGQGYRTQILEFIDMEHTPKNILIRAVKQGEKLDNEKELLQMMKEFRINPTLYNLLH